MTVDAERTVQNRIIGLLRKEFGFEYWGNLKDFDNTNINERVLRGFLVEKQKLNESQAASVVMKLKAAAQCTSFDDLYNANKAVYQMLRYPVQVATEPGKPSKQVQLIDWNHPLNNVFGIAEEVSVRKLVATEEHRRPDVVISVNGIALGVIELKKATVSVADGIRQNWRNQQNGEIPHFFATAQLLMAGSESEGLKYGTTRTPEKYWLTWKEPCGAPCAEPKYGPKRIKNLLDRSIVQFLDPERFLAFIHDGVVFDACFGCNGFITKQIVFKGKTAHAGANPQSGINAQNAAMLALQWPFAKLAFLVIKCSPEVKDLALKYFFIRIWAAPATLGLMSFRGWFIGMQDSVSSMMTDLVVNGVNIVASIVLSLGIGGWPGLGFPGVAAGTVAAQYSGLLYASLAAIFKYGRKVFGGFTFTDFLHSVKGGDMREFTRMNSDIFVRSLCFTGIYIGYTVISARYGDLMLASSAIMMKLLMIFSFFTDGFAYAGEALTGRFIGEKSLERTRMAIKYVFGWSLSLVALFMLVYWLGGVPLLRMMTSDGAVVEACRQFLPWLILMPPIGCAAFTWDGIYLGATASRGVRNGMLAALVAFFACWLIGISILRLSYGLPLFPDGTAMAAGPETERFQTMAIHILMIAYFAHLTARTVVMTLTYRKEVLLRHFQSL